MLQENILIILKRKGQTDRIITTHLIHALAEAENGHKKYIELSFVEYDNCSHRIVVCSRRLPPGIFAESDFMI